MGAQPTIAGSGVPDAIFAACDTTREAWQRIRSVTAASGCTVRRRVVTAMRSRGYSATRIATLLGVDRATVRRICRLVEAQPTSPPVTAKRRLPVAQPVATGDAMVAAPGPRHDCIHESACLRVLLKAHPAHDPPRHASCPVACTRLQAQDIAALRYDATRAALWGTK